MTPARKFQLFFSAWERQGKKKSSEQIVPQPPLPQTSAAHSRAAARRGAERSRAGAARRAAERSGAERRGGGAERRGAERSGAARRGAARGGAERRGRGAERSGAERSGAQQRGAERTGAGRSGGGLYAEVEQALHKILEKAAQAADPRSPLLILQGTASPALQTGPWATDRWFCLVFLTRRGCAEDPFPVLLHPDHP